MNFLWLLLGGLLGFAVWFVIGLSLCLTVIGIPFGIKCFKTALLVVWPFGTHVEGNLEEHPYLNLFWLLIIGLPTATIHFAIGCILCLSVIGIPFALQFFKISHYLLAPFGADYYPAN